MAETADMSRVPCHAAPRPALPAGEAVLFEAANPTEHRSGDYAIVVTQRALYWYSPFWLWFARWRRYPLDAMVGARFVDSRWAPKLVIRNRRGRRVVRTPFDYQDCMDQDRTQLRKTAEFLGDLIARRSVPAASFRGISEVSEPHVT